MLLRHSHAYVFTKCLWLLPNPQWQNLVLARTVPFCRAPPFWLNSDNPRNNNNLVSRTEAICFSRFLPSLPSKLIWRQPDSKCILWTTHQSQNIEPAPSSDSHKKGISPTLELFSDCLGSHLTFSVKQRGKERVGAVASVRCDSHSGHGRKHKQRNWALEGEMGC